MPGNTSDQENVENEIQVEEDSTYPLDSNILYRKRINNITKRSFNYNIIKEGVYPNGMESKSKKTNNTSRKKSYKIPHGYVVETTWGRSLKLETKAKISGPLLFGLQLDSVRKARETRKRGNLIKPAIDCIPLTLEKCAKKITTRIQFNFKNDVKGVYHQSDQVILKNVEFSVNEMNYFQVNYGSESEINKTYKFHSVVKAVDQVRMGRVHMGYFDKDFLRVRMEGFLKVRMERVHMGYFDIDFLRVCMEGFVWDILIEILFVKFFKSSYGKVRMGRVHMGYFDKDFLRIRIEGDFLILRFLSVRMGRIRMEYFDKDFLRVRMGRVCMGYFK
ncbi:22076_t:CDS:2 [Rhizophagus irregularis]|nr:22076_t:CDS:2 [Rhizophagus irregularis]